MIIERDVNRVKDGLSLRYDFFDDCQYKLNFMSEEFKVKKEKNKYYFACFEDKKKKRRFHRNNIKS